MKSLDNFLDENRKSFWPWIVLVGVLTAFGVLGCFAGQAAQEQNDRGAGDQRGALGTAQPGRGALAHRLLDETPPEVSPWAYAATTRIV